MRVERGVLFWSVLVDRSMRRLVRRMDRHGEFGGDYRAMLVVEAVTLCVAASRARAVAARSWSVEGREAARGAAEAMASVGRSIVDRLSVEGQSGF